MAENLKDKYLNQEFFLQLSTDLKSAYPALNQKKFYQQCTGPLDQLELMQRITHLTKTVADHLPDNYKKAISSLYDLSEIIDEKFGYLFMSKFVSTYGMNDYNTSIKALRDFTHHCSSEFAIRDFLKKDFEQTIKHMQDWAENDNEHIRRLASEGSRPRLPWAGKLQQVIDKPSLTWAILNKLKNDPAKYVQKSVANHLNDISKDNADWMIKKISQWPNKKTPQWIIKHGCRTLIKQGHTPTLSLLGFEKPDVKINNVKIKNHEVKIGDSLEFSFEITNKAKNTQNLVIDYNIHFLKKNNQHQAKTFKLKTFCISATGSSIINKNHKLKLMTTRKLYNGKHLLEILVNGVSYKKLDFVLKV